MLREPGRGAGRVDPRKVRTKLGELVANAGRRAGVPIADQDKHDSVVVRQGAESISCTEAQDSHTPRSNVLRRKRHLRTIA